jgi:hemoglobin-like flavoprotein
MFSSYSVSPSTDGSTSTEPSTVSDPCTTTAEEVNASAAVASEMLLQRRKQVIRSSWKIIEDSYQVEAAMAVYRRLFSLHPSTKSMFGHVSMRAQADKLYEVLRIAVRFLDSMDELLPFLQDQGVRHARGIGVQRKHYRYMADVLVEIMIQHMPVPANVPKHLFARDLADAWGWIMMLLGDTMADAADEELARLKVDKSTNERL